MGRSGGREKDEAQHIAVAVAGRSLTRPFSFLTNPTSGLLFYHSQECVLSKWYSEYKKNLKDQIVI
jgi:hypothetical protein